jgi:site-specific DNA-methyltransferase (adenine-specific)
MINLKCGDCLELMKTIPDESIDMILADPPYNITQNKWDIMIDIPKMREQCERIIKPNGAMVFFGTGKFTAKLILSNERLYRYSLVYAKTLSTGFLNANRMPLRAHEDILVFYKKLPTYNPYFREGKPYSRHTPNALTDCYGTFTPRQGGEYEARRYPTSVIKINNSSLRSRGTVHPTQKPVEICEWLIKTYTNKGDTVLDFCIGSGTTGVACVNTERDFIGFEIDEKYFEIAKQRIEEVVKK